jgi:hypothetical protein
VVSLTARAASGKGARILPDEILPPLIASRRSQSRCATPRQAAPPPPVGGCPATPDIASPRRAAAGRRGATLVVEEHRMSVRTAPPPLRPGQAARTIASPGIRSVAGAFLVLMMGFGAAYSFAAFAVPIQAELGLSRMAVSVVVALSGATTYLVSLLSGPIADRAGARWPVSLDIVLVALGLGRRGSFIACCAGAGATMLV